MLHAGIPVRLRSATRPATEVHGGTALLSLCRVAPEPQDDTGAFDAEVPQQLATDGEALVLFPGPGTYRLGLSKRWRSGDGTPYRTLPSYDAPAPEVEVREQDANGLLTLDLPAVILPYWTGRRPPLHSKPFQDRIVPRTLRAPGGAEVEATLRGSNLLR